MLETLAPLTLALCAWLQAGGSPDEPQIDWQRSLDDALALARAEQRKLLIAVNADGESASERIVRERYRDADFVAWTRPFVCVVASVFRHAPRDVDAAGRRVPCPRLGQVTCGEHIALEPLVHERFLAGAVIELDGELVERISPRHVLVDPDGVATFDLFLLFDLEVLDGELGAAAAAESGVAHPQPPLPAPEGSRAERRARLRALARDRSHAGRAALEALAWGEPSEDPWPLADALLHGGDAGSAGALYALREALGGERTAFVARAIGAGDALAGLAAGALQARGLLTPLAGGGPERELLERLDVGRWRTLRLSLDVVPEDELEELILAAANGRPERASEPPPAPARPSAADLELELAELEPLFAAGGQDPELQRRFALALAGLARERAEAGDGSAGFLLEDAGRELERAHAAFPLDAALCLESARCAYYRSDFEDQERWASVALAIEGLDPDTRVEALRWLGDAGARLIAARALGDEAAERAGLERSVGALAEVALGPEADATDWQSLASFFGATLRPGEQCAVAAEGLESFPESDALRAVYAGGAHAVGAPEALAQSYRGLAERRPDSAASAWYAGWALVNLAEWQRRGELPSAALSSYAQAVPRFARAVDLVPAFAETSEHYLGMCALGSGFARLLLDQRAEAADELERAIRIRPALDGVRDGLDREALDLVDGLLEWRETGASPVDGPGLAERLIAADPANARWAGAVADALLREGLRAIGRDELGAGIDGLRDSVRAARSVLAADGSQENRRALAQSATTLAETLIGEGLETAEPGPLLVEAALLLGLEPPSLDAPREVLACHAAELREVLGPARPVPRPGR